MQNQPCHNCRIDRASGPDGLCDDCRLAVSDRDALETGGLCARCDLVLADDGTCPNPQCPFHDTRQDELTSTWTPPDPEERAHV